MEEYVGGSRSYAMRATEKDGIQLRVFREKDVPIQIALGNYDLGICGLGWVEDLMQRYPSDAVVRVRDLGIGRCSVYVAAAERGATRLAEDQSETLRWVSGQLTSSLDRFHTQLAEFGRVQSESQSTSSEAVQRRVAE